MRQPPPRPPPVNLVTICLIDNKNSYSKYKKMWHGNWGSLKRVSQLVTSRGKVRSLNFRSNETTTQWGWVQYAKILAIPLLTQKYLSMSSWFETGLKGGLNTQINWVVFCLGLDVWLFLFLWIHSHFFISYSSLSTFVKTQQCNIYIDIFKLKEL